MTDDQAELIQLRQERAIYQLRAEKALLQKQVADLQRINSSLTHAIRRLEDRDRRSVTDAAERVFDGMRE